MLPYFRLQIILLNMKALLSLLLVLGYVSLSWSQVTDPEKNLRDNKIDTLDGWKTGGLVSIAGSQVSLTNWNAGGQNSISATGLVSVFANYTKGKAQWETSLDLGYGLQRLGKKDNVAWVKTDDKINLFSKFGRQASKHWFYSGMLNFNTQSTNGYNYPNDSLAISRFMAPGYLLIAAGMDYKPNKIFSAFIAPFTMKSTFVMDQTLADAGSFGVEAADTSGAMVTPGKSARFEMGGYIRLAFQHEVIKNVNIKSKLGMFSNYLVKPGNIDFNWETLIQFKVNKYISATLSTHLIYDDDIDIAVFNDAGVQTGKGPRVQFKEVLGVGFAFKFPDKTKEAKPK